MKKYTIFENEIYTYKRESNLGRAVLETAAIFVTIAVAILIANILLGLN